MSDAQPHPVGRARTPPTGLGDRDSAHPETARAAGVEPLRVIDENPNAATNSGIVAARRHGGVSQVTCSA
jgi:hypothetical protein